LQEAEKHQQAQVDLLAAQAQTAAESTKLALAPLLDAHAKSLDAKLETNAKETRLLVESTAKSLNAQVEELKQSSDARSARSRASSQYSKKSAASNKGSERSRASVGSKKSRTPVDPAKELNVPLAPHTATLEVSDDEQVVSFQIGDAVLLQTTDRIIQGYVKAYLPTADKPFVIATTKGDEHLAAFAQLTPDYYDDVEASDSGNTVQSKKGSQKSRRSAG
jgi:hypothetical protein